MKDSLTLQWMMTQAQLQSTLNQWLVNRLQVLGHEQINVSRLVFLGQLECGDNHAADVARILGVSRQMVAKNVRELVALGLLQQSPGTGRTKLIQFTHKGEQLMADCRSVLAEMDQWLADTSARLSDWTAQMKACISQLDK